MLYLLNMSSTESESADVSSKHIARLRTRKSRRSVLVGSMTLRGFLCLVLLRINAEQTMLVCLLICPFYSYAQLRVTSKLVSPLLALLICPYLIHMQYRPQSLIGVTYLLISIDRNSWNSGIWALKSN